MTSCCRFAAIATDRGRWCRVAVLRLSACTTKTCRRRRVGTLMIQRYPTPYGIPAPRPRRTATLHPPPAAGGEGRGAGYPVPLPSPPRPSNPHPATPPENNIKNICLSFWSITPDLPDWEYRQNGNIAILLFCQIGKGQIVKAWGDWHIASAGPKCCEPCVDILTKHGKKRRNQAARLRSGCKTSSLPHAESPEFSRSRQQLR